MAEDADFQHGGIVFPLDPLSARTLLEDADPTLFYAIDFLKWSIETYVGARLAAGATADGASSIGAAVAMAVPFDPGPYLTSDQVKFPLLAVYRIEEELANRTVTWRHSKGVWGVAYVLPPLTAGQRETIGPILNAVARVLDNRTEHGADPGYTPPGGAQGDSVWARAGLEQISFRRGRFVRWEDGGDLVFEAYVAELEVHERVKPVAGAYADLSSIGTNIEARVPGDTGAAVETVAIEADTDP